MRVADLFGMAGSNLTRRKGRTVLTTVGVVIGVGALVLMVSLGIGLKLQLLKSFESEDILRTITVTRVEGKSEKRPRVGMFGAVGQIVQISTDEIKGLEALPGVDYAHPDLFLALPCDIPLAQPMEGRNEIAADFIPFTGIHEKEMPGIEKMLLRGRMWRPGEHGCLVPSGLIEMRFGLKVDEVALDRPLTLKLEPKDGEPAPPADTLKITVLGIVDSERLGLKSRQILLPLDHALEIWEQTQGGFGGMFLYKKGKYPAVEVKVRRPEDVDAVKNRIKNMGYEALAATDLLEMINTTFLVLEGFLACIGAIGLLVALFGIANTMAMSVLERTREVGIMKALGAPNSDVLFLFLLEAAWIGFLGGVVGLGGGWALGKILNAAAREVFELPPRTSLFHVSSWLAFGALGFAVLVSVIAGVIPAIRASRKDPVVALRYE